MHTCSPIKTVVGYRDDAPDAGLANTNRFAALEEDVPSGMYYAHTESPCTAIHPKFHMI